MITIEKIKKALKKTKHPEFDKNLIELGMIRNIKIKHHRRIPLRAREPATQAPKNLRKRFLLGAKDKIIIDLVLPFLHVPIKEQLIKIIEKSVKKNFDITPTIKIKEMNQKEKKKFGDMVKKVRGFSPW